MTDPSLLPSERTYFMDAPITRNGKIEHTWALYVVNKTLSLQDIFITLKSGEPFIIFFTYLGPLEPTSHLCFDLVRPSFRQKFPTVLHEFC